jgi:hypothetical protein
MDGAGDPVRSLLIFGCAGGVIISESPQAVVAHVAAIHFPFKEV